MAEFPLAPPDGVDERGWWAERIWLPWIDKVKPLQDSVVLEYGSGPGSVSRAVAPMVARHIGLDINPDYVDTARTIAADAGQHNSLFRCHPADEIVDALRGFTGEVDIVLLYAVIEHLTVDERLAVLSAARDVVRPDGVIAIVELPNRLVDFDQHSTWLPFVNQLPEPLALEYLGRATRKEFRDEVLTVRDETRSTSEDADALMALARFGRGASFHEFELVWEGELSDCVLKSGWDPDVIPHREIDPDEIALARSLQRRRPELGPCWARQWIDLLLSPHPRLAKPRHHRPWTGIAGPASHHVAYSAPEVIFLGQSDSALHVELPEATSHLAFRVVDGESLTAVSVEGLDGSVAEGQSRCAPGHAATVLVDLEGWHRDLVVRLPRGGWILAVLYSGHGP